MANQAWAPQSPDLSGYAPRSPDLSAYKPKTKSTWSPQPSSDLGAFQNSESNHFPPQFNLYNNGWDQRLQAPQGYGQSPYSNNPYPTYHQPTSNPGYYPVDMPPTTRSQQRVKEEQPSWMSNPYAAPPMMPQMPQMSQYPPDVKPTHPYQQQPPPPPQPAPTSSSNMPVRKLDTRGIEVKTKFPTARIKRIMQADEDVGKVAQVTPVVMAKALELFMIRLITASSDVAKSRNSKRVQTAHMKQAVMQDDQFDNLREIVNKVPDAPPKKAAANSDDEEGDGPKKRKKSTAGAAKGKKRRGSDDEF